MKSLILTFVSFIILVFYQSVAAQNPKLINEKLSKISFLSVNNIGMALPEDSVLRKYLKIESISEDDFIAKQKNTVNFLVSDTVKFRKKNGIIRLPLTAGTKKLTDKDTGDDGMEVFDYLGQFPFLKAYLIRIQYWESINYKLLSKSNGAESAQFASIPLISPDKKKLIIVATDGYENDSGIEIMSITNKFKSTLSVRFQNWITGDEDQIFIASDGKMYLPVQFTDKSIQESERTMQNLFVRISIL